MPNPIVDEEIVRKNKLKKLKSLGINPYPSKTNSKTEISVAKEKIGEVFWISGRITSIRPHGKITFVDITDESGKMQAFVGKNDLDEKYQAEFELLDAGDFVEIHGEIFLTKVGEKTIRADRINILSKAILPFPKEFYGIKDTEIRYRKRFLDFVLNKESKNVIETRSKTISFLRKFMEENGFIEIETPILQPIPGGAAAKPFVTHYNILKNDFYLRIATELHLKRLVVGGFERVYEIGRIFRNEGLSHMHNPEFTSMEFYWAYRDYKDLMDFSEEMISGVTKNVIGTTKVKFQDSEIDFKPPYERIKFADLVEKDCGINIWEFKDIDSLKKEIKKNKIDIDMSDIKVWSNLVDELYKKVSRPKIVKPVFVTDQPIELVPLAKRNSNDPKTAEMFQLVAAGGMEIIKAYSELNDPIEQEERMREQMKMREAGWEEGERLDLNFIEALGYGMPPTAGWGMGIDRFVMILTNQYSIKEVIPFPTLKPEK